MTTYAIGSVKGYYQPLLKLLEKIQFDRDNDCLWFAGNLVNEGPESLAVLRFVKNLGKSAITVRVIRNCIVWHWRKLAPNRQAVTRWMKLLMPRIGMNS